MAEHLTRVLSDEQRQTLEAGRDHHAQRSGNAVPPS